MVEQEVRRFRTHGLGDFDCGKFVKPGARVYVIDSKEAVRKMPQQWQSMDMVRNFGLQTMAGTVNDYMFYPDFEALAREYDAVEFVKNAETQFCLAWDVDSVCVFNPDAIEIVRHNSVEAQGHDYHSRLAKERYPEEDDLWDDEE